MNPTPVPATVLYAEDEETDVFFMRAAFQKLGLDQSLRAVGNGQEAMDYLAGNGRFTDRQRFPVPTVLLLDLNLPLISGFEVLKWLRARPQFQTLPVVVFSSSTRETDRLKAKEFGANEFVEKPSSGAGFGGVAQQIRSRWLIAR
jgi:CheY-like chemotaxis protein